MSIMALVAALSAEALMHFKHYSYLEVTIAADCSLSAMSIMALVAALSAEALMHFKHYS